MLYKFNNSIHKGFSFAEKQEILKNFPNIKLSYENIIHNKVVNNKINTCDLYLAIPCGKKCFAWFTSYNDENVCFIMELMENKNIYDIKIYNCVFNSDLTYGNGTIVYGTHFNHKQTNFFAIENIYYWKGNDITNYGWYDKLKYQTKLFEGDIKQVCYNKKYIIFGLPLLASNLEDLKKHIDSVEYKIYSLQLRNLNKLDTFDSILYKNLDINTTILKSDKIVKQIKQILPEQSQVSIQIQDNKQKHINTRQFSNYTPKQVVFKIKPDIQNDIYHLYCLNDSIETYYKVAYIPDYKTSVMMNKLFRNIKENENLDSLEESDDEEEFQNEREDRFVHLNTSYNMLCGFNYKFKKWYPINLVNDNVKIIQQSELSKYDKK
jgi:hypothetical protein